MSCYAKIEPAIRKYEVKVRSDHGSEFVEKVLGQFSEFNRKYYSNSENPDYSGNLRKFCYLYKYSVSHGYFLYQALKRLHKKIDPMVFQRKKTRVACIGGGPGSEIIGICRFLNETGGARAGEREVEITIFDREPSWEAACAIITQCVSKNLSISVKFKTFDATDSRTYSEIDFSIFNYVFTCFFASELRKLKITEKSNAFWKYLFKSLGPKRVFLAIDFRDRSGNVPAYIDSIIPEDRHPLIEVDDFDQSCPDSKLCIQDLEKTLDHRPKKNGQNFIRAFITK